jgi:hypothetical protein
MIKTSIEDSDQLLLPRLPTAIYPGLGGTTENAGLFTLRLPQQ